MFLQPNVCPSTGSRHSDSLFDPPGAHIDRPGVPTALTDQSDQLRKRAARARQHARDLSFFDEAAPRLLAYADELDALADRIEAGKPDATPAKASKGGSR